MTEDRPVEISEEQLAAWEKEAAAIERVLGTPPIALAHTIPYLLHAYRQARAEVERLRAQVDGERLNHQQIHTGCHAERDALQEQLEAERRRADRWERHAAELMKLACTDDIEVALGWVTAMQVAHEGLRRRAEEAGRDLEIQAALRESCHREHMTVLVQLETARAEAAALRDALRAIENASPPGVVTLEEYEKFAREHARQALAR